VVVAEVVVPPLPGRPVLRAVLGKVVPVYMLDKMVRTILKAVVVVVLVLVAIKEAMAVLPVLRASAVMQEPMEPVSLCREPHRLRQEDSLQDPVNYIITLRPALVAQGDLQVQQDWLY
jgi:hypothetical protein